MHFQLPARYQYGAHIGALLHAWGLQLEQEETLTPIAHQLLTAFQEAYNNIVLHAYEGREGDPLEIIIERLPHTLQLTFKDQGRPYQPATSNELPDFSKLEWEDWPEGGMGLSLMDSCMDEVQREKAGETNILVMRKKLKPLS